MLLLMAFVIRMQCKSPTLWLIKQAKAMNFQMFKLELEKAKEPEIKLPTSVGSSRKQEKNPPTSALLTMPKPLTVWISTNCGKFFKRWEYQTT